MKVGDIVYRKTPFQVVAIGKEVDGELTHLSLQAVENTQYINCLDTEVETSNGAADASAGTETSAASETPAA